MIRALLIAAMLAGAPALAADAGLTIGRVRYVVAVPPGYCTDTAPARAYMKEQREADAASAPDIALIRCADTSFTFDYFAIALVAKTVRTNRLTVLSQMRRVMTGQIPGGIPDTDEALAARAAAVVVLAPQEQTNQHPIGVDDVCAYSGGTFSLSHAPGITTVVSCSSAIGRHQVVITRFLPGVDPKGARAIPGELKRLMLSIRRRT